MDKIEELLTRGVSAVFPDKAKLEEILKSGKKLRIYNGIDPTGRLHIGHMVVLRKLKQFQDLGHEVIVLIGDFTAQIGDPTDKSATRKKLSKEQVDENSRNYKNLISKILDTGHADMKFLHNEEWSNKLKPVDMLELASNFTVQQLIERDMFQNRIKEGKEVYLHEFLYPVFQAYDSVTMDVDIEIGGNDQTFNMMAGRALMKKLKNKEKFVLATKLLTDPQGKKMGKTEGNVINLDDSAEDIYGKVMSFPDELIEIGYELLTDRNLNEIDKNPRDAKAGLAYDVVKQLYSEEEAKKTAREFDSRFRDKKMPETINEVLVKSNKFPSLLVEAGLASSNSEAQRLINQGGVKLDNQVVQSSVLEVSTSETHILQVGKFKIVKIRFE